MERQNKKKNVSKRNEKLSQYDGNYHRIFSANRAMINVGPRKTRLVFFDDSPKKKLGDSKGRQYPIEIQLKKSIWLDCIDEWSLKTVLFLMGNKRKDSKEIPKNPPEIMFR